MESANGCSGEDDTRGDVSVIVMSDSGKPIFSCSIGEEDVARICGLLQALRSSILYNPALSDLGDIKTVQAGAMHVVFLTAGAITLVAISTVATADGATNGDDTFETEAYLRLQLEYIYAHIIFSMTEQVQAIFKQNASFDLRSMLGNDANMRDFLSRARDTPAPFLTAGIQTVFPISFESRNRSSSVLKQVGEETSNTLFALLFIGNRLVTAVQPFYRPHQLRTADLHLLLDFINRQQPSTGELWLPVCLPRFNSSGFLNCYTQRLDAESGLQLALLSQCGTTDQFQSFRTAAVRIRRCLGIPDASTNVLQILDSGASFESAVGSGKDVQWRRSHEKKSEEVSEEFDDEDYEMISYEFSGDGSSSGLSCQLLPELAAIYEKDSTMTATMLQEYLDVGVFHFCFRIDVAILEDRKKSKNGKESVPGHMTQCISPPLGAHFVNAAAKRRVWNVYQRLHLRLRLGSASTESTNDAFRMISEDHAEKAAAPTPTVSKHCPSMCLAESPPNIQGVSYLKQGGETFLAMNGRGFELYLVGKSSAPVEQTAALGAKLVRRLIADEKTLFLSSPLAWKE